MDGALLLLFLLLRPLVCVQSRHFCTLTTRGNTEGTSFSPFTFPVISFNAALLLCDIHFACVLASRTAPLRRSFRLRACVELCPFARGQRGALPSPLHLPCSLFYFIFNPALRLCDAHVACALALNCVLSLPMFGGIFQATFELRYIRQSDNVEGGAGGSL